MIESQLYRLLLLLALFAGLYSVSVNGTNSKRGCLGDAIHLFQNIQFNSNDTVVSIYKNIDSSIILAMWQIKNKIPSIINGQSDRMSLDKKGNIWILNLQESDEGNYAVKLETGGNYMKEDMSLVVMAAPTNNCKPKIIRVDNNLIAKVKASECGRPAASVYWMEHTGICIERDVIKLKPGRENGIYHACIEGDALLCAKVSNPSDYCSIYNYNESEPLIEQRVEGSGPSQLPGLSPTALSAIIIGICLMTAIILIFVTFLSVKKIITLCQRIEKKLPGKRRVDHRKDGTNSNGGELDPLDTRSNTRNFNPKKFSEQVSVEEESRDAQGKPTIEDTYQKSSGTVRSGPTPVPPDDDSELEESHQKLQRGQTSMQH